MNKLLLFIGSLLILTGCKKENEPTPDLKEEAKTALRGYVRDFLLDNEIPEIKDTDIIYEKDSLIIIRFPLNLSDVSAPQEPIDTLEFVFLKEDGINYVSVNPLNEDKIFMDSIEWTKTKDSLFDESLDYHNTIRYNAANLINAVGSQAIGDSIISARPYVKVPGKYGGWKLNYYSDKKGHKTKDKYISVTGHGFYAAPDDFEDLKIELLVDNNNFSFSLYKDKYRLVKDDLKFYVTEVTDSRNRKYEFMLWNINGQVTPLFDVEGDYKKMREILSSEGKIFVKIDYYKIERAYMFRLDLTGFNNAFKTL